MADKNTYCEHETPAELALEGLPLASFGRRAAAYVIDLIVIGLIIAAMVGGYMGWRVFVLGQHQLNLEADTHDLGNLITVVLYHAAFAYFTNGRTPGKWAAGIRVVSLTGPQLGMWQSVERALGYGAAMLEGGLGFAQYFWSPNRMCAQDRLAETIVVSTRTV